MAGNDDVRSLAEANREAGGGTQEQKIRLGVMVAAAVQAREATDAELLQQALSPMAEAVSSGPQSTGWLANLSFLVDRGSAEQSLSAVDEFRQENPHLEMRATARCRPTASSTPLRPSRPKAAPRKHSEPTLCAGELQSYTS
jgi:hypothetical protein